MGRLRKRKYSVTRELGKRKRTLQRMGVVGSFIDTRHGLLGGLKARTAGQESSPQVAHNVESPIRYSTPCRVTSHQPI
jgi:hypothetical protein